MKIAIISDLHGNLPALEAAAADAKARGARRILCAGDLVGYGPFPSETCEFVARNAIESVSGNFDRKVLEAMDNPELFDKKMNARKREVLIWTVKHTSRRAGKILRGLPPAIEVRAAGSDLLLVHGSPGSDVDTIYPSITAEALARKLAGRKPDLLACGHTHIPFIRRISGVTVVNCGSAGYPVDGDPRPTYALLEFDHGKKPSARIIRFSYDAAKTVGAIASTDLPESLLRDFAEGTKRM